jgi:hypothetical protein
MTSINCNWGHVMLVCLYQMMRRKEKYLHCYNAILRNIISCKQGVWYIILLLVVHCEVCFWFVKLHKKYEDLLDKIISVMKRKGTLNRGNILIKMISSSSERIVLYSCRLYVCGIFINLSRELLFSSGI